MPQLTLIKDIYLPEWGWTVGVLGIAFLFGWLLSKGSLQLSNQLSHKVSTPWFGWVNTYFKKSLFLFFPALLLYPLAELLHEGLSTVPLFQGTVRIVATLFAIFFAIDGARFVTDLIKARYDITQENNLQARRMYTKLEVMHRIIIALIILLGAGSILTMFDDLRGLGVSLLASAGVTGVVIGFASQKVLGNLLAGIQIAFTQPINLGDAVVVEGEWGWIEEITLTYVVIKIWDRRRLIIPISYFIEKPFQNWTRTSGQILGDVYLYLDYRIPVGPLRAELDRILEATPMWDRDAKVLQVVDMTDKVMVLRGLMTAKSSPICWDLRCHVREQLLTFIQKNYREYLPHSRVLFSKEVTDLTSN